MTGSIFRNVDNKYLAICGGTSTSTSAYLQVVGKDNSEYPGWFRLYAKNGTNSCGLIGKPDGTFQWGGNDIITSAGGQTINGTLNISNTTSNILFDGKILKQTVDDDFITICGGSSTNNSPYFQVYGKNHSAHPGHFQIVAKDDTSARSLIGTAQGDLTWVNNDLAGAAIVAKNLTQKGYINYASGLIIQWGIGQTITYNNKWQINFSINFTTTFAISYSCSNQSDYIINSNGRNKSANTFTLYKVSTSSLITTGTVTIDYITIGY